MQGYWSRFAATGDPNGNAAPTWQAFDTARSDRLNLNLDPSMVEDFRTPECAMWFGYFDSLFSTQ